MKSSDEKDLTNKPSKQLYLYKYDSMFNLFINTIKKNKLPQCSILTGQKGSGKSTFAYHLVNYMLSVNEQHPYSIKNNYIHPKNYSYHLVNSKTHPCFFLIDNMESEDSIKITQIRSLLKFLRNTTYENNLKIVLIDNVEALNLNSANALLKCLEEPTQNTFFILVQNNAHKIIDTIKSRCIEFKFFLNTSDKKDIFYSLCNEHNINIKNHEYFFKNFYFDTPGNLINYVKYFEEEKIDLLYDDKLSLNHLVETFLKNKALEVLPYISVLIEKYYNELVQKNPLKNKKYFFNRTKILKYLNEMKVFNLDTKNTFLTIKNILEIDAR
jgi:DNA polymerase III subunit delta'